ncbi:MAG: glycosyltransferase family 9 protein [Elusimicrobia bacterium]|nr:glycosyltransferase family 9 protein [Elusimicrobiota bacterium]
MAAEDPTSPASILVVQLRRLGDVILTVPALEAIKKRWPAARLDFLVEAPGAEAVAGVPAIDEVLVYDARGALGALAWARRIRARRYDWVIDFLANPRTALLTALSGAKIKAGPAHVRRRWAYNRRLVQPEKPCYAAREKVLWLKDLGVRPEDAPELPRLRLAERPAEAGNVVGLIPPSRKVTRRWPAASWIRLGKLLRERRGCALKVFWGPGERELAQAVARGIGAGAEIIPETRTIADLARELASCRVVVSNCAGPKHVAVGLGVPTVTIHGSSDPVVWTPPHPDHRAVRLDELECIGCRRNDCPYHLECLNQLPAERVLPAALELLDRAEAAAR